MLAEAPRPASIYERYSQLKEIPREGFPRHVLVIPDGNRRYARALQQTVSLGHQQGANVSLGILRDMRELPIAVVSFWAFSSDNWKRPQDEVDTLMQILDFTIQGNVEELMRDNIRMVHLGRKDRIPPFLQKTIADAEEVTAQNSGQTLCVAIDFGGRDQELRMFQQAVETFPKGAPISSEDIEKLRDGQGTIPPADLIIRTSERRTSDVGWLNGANTELYFIENKLYPELTTEDVVDAMHYFSTRKRRLGA